jgi:hypothetical protein
MSLRRRPLPADEAGLVVAELVMRMKHALPPCRTL